MWHAARAMVIGSAIAGAVVAACAVALVDLPLIPVAIVLLAYLAFGAYWLRYFARRRDQALEQASLPDRDSGLAA